MKIACLGWGSLIWDPKELLIQRQWFKDGPLLPLEFARQSNNGRLTLVITGGAKPVPTLWTLMTTEDLNGARQSLLTRENIPPSRESKYIGVVTSTEVTEDQTKLTIQKWAIQFKIDAVIWTNLPPKFQDSNHNIPSVDEALAYLERLEGESKIRAEEYIRKAPKQINTAYRSEFEKKLGWTHSAEV